MLAKCITNSAKQLGTPGVDAFFTLETRFENFLKQGEEYQILGLSWSMGTLLALVFDESRRPRFLPVGLFDFDAMRLPPHWEFKVWDGVAASGGAAPEIRMAVWGYPEFARDHLHADRLQEADPAALKIFFRELQKENEAAGRDAWA